MLTTLNAAAVFIPALLAFVPLFLIVTGISYWKKKSALFRKKNPLNNDLLRSPGETLRNEIEDINLDITAYFSIITVVPLVLYSTMLTIHTINEQPAKTATAIIYVFMGIIALGFCVFKMIKIIKRKRNLTLGLEAELAIGQELNELARDGARIFHDIPADGFNIDHVVVSPKGIFAIETKGRSKPVHENGKAAGWKVEHDGTTLKFPGWQETEPFKQAERQAAWLQNWLTKATGESVSAKPVLMLPGWYVDGPVTGRVLVLNGKKTQSFFTQNGEDTLSPTLITRIAHQLDQRCRNIKPT